MKRKIAIVVIEFLKNIATGFWCYVACIFVMIGMFYTSYLSGNVPVSVYSEVEIREFFLAIGYLFVVIKLIVPIFEATTCGRWRQMFSEMVAAAVVIIVMYTVPEVTHWICTVGINGKFWYIVCLVVVSTILKYVLRFLEIDRRARANVVSHGYAVIRNKGAGKE